MTLPMSAELRAAINELLELKRATDEGSLNPQLPVIQNFIRTELIHQKQLADTMPDDHKKDWDALNRVFREIII